MTGDLYVVNRDDRSFAKILFLLIYGLIYGFVLELVSWSTQCVHYSVEFKQAHFYYFIYFILSSKI